MNFSADTYRQAVADYNCTWRAADVALHDLCRHYPDHCDPGGVRAKLWIIGRTYATGIERKITTKGTQGSSLEQLASHIMDNAAVVTDVFRRLSKVAEPLTPDRLQMIIHLHGRFTRFVSQKTRNSQSPRSFCSKYMHFHCPAVPIYDSYAAVTLQRLVRWRDSFQLFDLPADADHDYARYVLRFWQLYQQALAAGIQPTVRHLDIYLLHVAEAAA